MHEASVCAGWECSRAYSRKALQGATPDAYDARATHPGSSRRRGSLSARADSESRERLHLDAIDATDGADDAIDAMR